MNENKVSTVGSLKDIFAKPNQAVYPQEDGKMINFFHVEAGLLDLEEQPPVNQCHSLSTMTAAQSWLYNV